MWNDRAGGPLAESERGDGIVDVKCGINECVEVSTCPRGDVQVTCIIGPIYVGLLDSHAYIASTVRSTVTLPRQWYNLDHITPIVMFLGHAH